jgi:hypothetical protein
MLVSVAEDSELAENKNGPSNDGPQVEREVV